MFKAIKELFGQKRLWLPMIGTGVISSITALLVHLQVPETIIGWVIAGLSALFGGGVLNNASADFGKEKAKLENE